MNRLTRSPLILVFATGLLCGLLIGMTIDRGWSGVVSKVLWVGSIVVISLFWQRAEEAAHIRHMRTWAVGRVRGKWRFIIRHYILLRGALLFIITMVPSYLNASLPFIFSWVTMGAVAAFVLLFGYLGNEEWTRCEAEFEIQALRLAAEQTRFTMAMQN